MSPKKVERKKLKNFKSLVSKNLNLNKFKVNPAGMIENTKSKIGNFYTNLKKERLKEKKRLENRRKLEEKRELQREKNKLKKKD